MWNRIYILLVAALLGGCASYPVATVKDGVIANPSVGWNGYSVKIPNGLIQVRPTGEGQAEDREAKIREWYSEANTRYTADYYSTRYEQFLIENPEQTYFISFIAESYTLRTGWNMMTSFDKQYIIQKLMNRKMVVINDTKAHHEQIELGGQRGWYISGGAKPYFKKNAETVAYEGVFLLGNLKEVYWFEAFGSEAGRAEMKKRVHEMAESLDVH